MASKLEEIHGIGKKLQSRILEHFGNDEVLAVRALKNCMGGIIPGISQKKAIDIARSLFENEHDINMKDILKTEPVIELYNDIVEKISEYFITEYSKNKISLFFPLGPKNLELIKQRYGVFGRAIKLVNKYGNYLDKNNLSDYLNDLSLLKQSDSLKKIRTRHIITDSKQTMKNLELLSVNQIIDCELIKPDTIKDPNKDLQELADSFETLIMIMDNVTLLPDFINVVPLDSSEISEENLIPERLVNFFACNSKIIDSICEICRILQNIQDKSLIREFLDVIKIDKIEELQHNTRILDDYGSIIEGYDEDLDTFRQDASLFTGKIIEVENWINEKIKDDINKSAITIQGEKILDLYRSDFTMDQIRRFIPSEVEELIEEVIGEGILKIEEDLHISKSEKHWLTGLDPEVFEIPVSLNYKGINDLEFNIKKRASIYEYKILKEIASGLKEYEDYINQLIWIMLEFEFFYAIGRFAVDYHLEIPSIVEKVDKQKRGFLLENGFNLYLMNKTIINNEKTVPINYCVGDLTLDKIESSRLNLLSGSNSGGKTMCLYSIAHSLILAQMGFPTPGKLIYNPFSEFYFFKKSTGQLSAGAFESTLLMFLELAQSSKYKIILADELEAITEPNAAAKVISAIFSLILENSKNYAVFVTHLIDLLYENMSIEEQKQIRIDGIEAKGLDKQLELIVDRSPKFNYIARSTPEFILERLSKKGKTSQREFFTKVLQKFNRNP
ncbi:MAG: hypothetical protein GF364_12715 [Candidatus Lokiarchaeota archaeon]|nr:hypothetical protein [Candidatus Lokiarchaeota archaeon]